MSYLVLARKYRPKTFAEVVGQDAVKRTLRGAVEAGRVGHAYLFAGPRGTGKTTTARILAKGLNCEQGPTADPCGRCERCLAADRGAEADLIEIDGASNNGVEHVRVLRDQAGYVPLRARFKVYLIDEVHMLSKAAFNALLKTLEEPPPHVKFLFATTEPHKVLDTILSRCQVLKLTPLPEETIAARLDEVLGLEGVEAEAGVTRELARRARGGMRDALSLADQLLAQVGDRPLLADVARLDEGADGASPEELLERVLAGDRAGVLAGLPATEGGEASLLSSLLDRLRAALIAALVGPDAPLLDAHVAGPEERERLAGFGRRLGAERLELWLQELLHARERMRLLPAHGRVLLEVTLLDLCDPAASLPLEELLRRLNALEAHLVAGGARPLPSPPLSGDSPRAQEPAPRALPAAERAAERAQAPRARASEPEPQRDVPRAAPAGAPRREPERPAPTAVDGPPRVRTNSTSDAWGGFLEELASGAPALADLLGRRGELVLYDGQSATVQLRNLGEGERALVADRRNQRACTKAFTRAVGREVAVTLQDAAAASPSAEDPFTRKVVDLFHGRVEE